MAVNLETHDHVAIVTLARPQCRNAVDRASARELSDAFRAFDADDGLHVAVLHGAGEHFCAGADLKALASGGGNRVAGDGDGPMGPTRMQLSKPVIAAVEGYAVAGGLELALWCDLRVASATAVFGVFCRRFGVPLVDLGAVRLPRLIGHGRAMDMILTGRAVDAHEAHRIGLADRLGEAGNALPCAVDLATQIASFPQRCLRNDRRLAQEQWSLGWSDAVALEYRLGMDTIDSGETLSGASRFRSGAGRAGKDV